MGLTITVNTPEEMCTLMCGNEIPKMRNKTMKIEEMIKHYNKYGICIYMMNDKNDGRKRYYKITSPIFENDKILPVGNKDYLVRNPAEVRKYIESVLLADSNYKRHCEEWVKNY